MANQEHLELLQRGSDVWNTWRQEHMDIPPDLYKANLNDADLSDTDLRGATLTDADLRDADLSDTDLTDADLTRADLTGAYLRGADLTGAYLRGAILTGAILRGANLTGADLTRATLIETNFEEAILTNCNIYGIAAWNVQLEGAKQENLVITDDGEPTITVDNLEVAQFIYLLLNNPKIRDVIDTVAKKAILILGRFTPERKAVLEAIRTALRERGYLPILFDFEKPSSQDLTETISTLAHLARFIIVDLTNPSSTPYEIGTIASNHIKPIQSIFQPSNETKHIFAMFSDLKTRYHWVLPPYQYQDQKNLLTSLPDKVIAPSERKVKELEALKARN
jgi:Pentapeptide repeats (8 copies)